MFSFSWKGRGASPQLPPVDLPSHTMQPKTADPLRAGISRALHIPLGQIKPATCCSIQSSSWMSHRLIMSFIWVGGRKNKKGRGTSPSRVSWWKQFFFPPNWWKIWWTTFQVTFGSDTSTIPIRLVLLSFSLSFTIYGTDIRRRSSHLHTSRRRRKLAWLRGIRKQKKSLAQRRRHGFLTRSIRPLRQ